MKLARKLTFALVLGVFVVLALSAYVRVRREAGIFEADIRRDNHTMGRALSAAVLEVWRTEGEARALHIVSEANERESQVDIRWVWLDAPDGDAFAPRLPRANVGPIREGREVVQKTPREGVSWMVTCLPVPVPSARLGALEISESLAGERMYIRATAVSTLFATAALTLVSGLITTGLGVWIVGRPMRALREQARRIGAGDLVSRLPIGSRDEIGELAEEMNRMSERLSTAQAEIARATSARIAALEQLRHAERLATVGKLASGVAHELGTPLQIVTGRAEMLAEGDGDTAETIKNARIIQEQSRRMTQIIRQLLDFARRRGTMRTGRADLARVVRDTFTLVSPLAQKRRITLRRDGESSLAEIEGDAEQAQQALTNVVVNAIQAMPRGGDIVVTLKRERARPPADHGGPEADYLALSVRDQGDGIPDDVKDHIFEPFFTTKPVGEGTGLGLSVAYGIISEHGGWIQVDSHPGEGSTFTFYFPCG
ncbi:sensor histidine kinase [Minicystis rosea]|nr:sensor histidine kinase [Minicystis rosea]